jgi:hypothetical protein
MLKRGKKIRLELKREPRWQIKATYRHPANPDMEGGEPPSLYAARPFIAGGSWVIDRAFCGPEAKRGDIIRAERGS